MILGMTVALRDWASERAWVLAACRLGRTAPPQPSLSPTHRAVDGRRGVLLPPPCSPRRLRRLRRHCRLLAPPPRRPPRDPPSASPPAAQIKILKSLTKKANRILNRKEVKRAARALKAAIAAAGGKAAFYKLHPEAKPVPNPPKELSEEAAAARREKRARKKEKKRRKELEKQQKEEEMRVGG